ncbi:lipopolysaccharide heptosyltransferase I [soil metagenome]|nr:glycosyltransferase family 9 protein [Acidobacteriota bacterium]
MNFLILRLGALGDIVHAVPAVAALRVAYPDARIDWLVEARHRAVVDLVTVVDRVVPLEGRSVAAWLASARVMRQVRYDVALDFQGLMKSAVLARLSGATRVIGFSIWHLREKAARPFYSETEVPPVDEGESHVIQKNLRLLATVGVRDEAVRFPLGATESAALAIVQAEAAGPFALLNPGAAWPNKRWPASRFGDVAAFLREVRGLPSFVLWGPGEESVAQEVVNGSSGAARLAPPTGLADLLALVRAAALMVSGDTGPLHIATAAGTPTVALFGPTDPARNGPWAAQDVSVSRYGACGCHYERRCRQANWCLHGLSVPEVTAAIQHRLAGIRHG